MPEACHSHACSMRLKANVRRTTPANRHKCSLIKRLERRLERRIEGLRQVMSDGFQMVISELENELDRQGDIWKVEL